MERPTKIDFSKEIRLWYGDTTTKISCSLLIFGNRPDPDTYQDLQLACFSHHADLT
jgi:hypothetical protein